MTRPGEAEETLADDTAAEDITPEDTAVPDDIVLVVEDTLPDEGAISEGELGLIGRILHTEISLT